MLFSEPKIPQSPVVETVRPARVKFQCSSASRKFLNVERFDVNASHLRFQCSSASRKFLNCDRLPVHRQGCGCFSALQRAENSSINHQRALPPRDRQVSVLFSEPKIPQLMQNLSVPAGHVTFQCSSASRKFLNSAALASLWKGGGQCFSALQRAENSSIQYRFPVTTARSDRFSALQRAENSSIRAASAHHGATYKVSVLFSEPKIPQLLYCIVLLFPSVWFQCSSASRKFLNSSTLKSGMSPVQSFSALQRAENSSILRPATVLGRDCVRFSALQRAENSSIFAR